MVGARHIEELTFLIDFHKIWGQNCIIVGNIPRRHALTTMAHAFLQNVNELFLPLFYLKPYESYKYSAPASFANNKNCKVWKI